MVSASPVSGAHVAPSAARESLRMQPRSRFATWRSSDHVRLVLIWLVLLAVPFAPPQAYLVLPAHLGLINLIFIASLKLLVGFGGQISFRQPGVFLLRRLALSGFYL